MLSKNQMVAVRKAIESTYTAMCTITEHQKIKKENNSTGFVDVVVLENEPCKLSFERITNTKATETASSLVQIAKLIISPDVVINAGSKLTITQNGVTNEYKNSGQPAIYGSHQEIILELFKGWS